MASLKIVRTIDADNPDIGDLYLSNGTVQLTTTLSDEVAQLLFNRFNSFQGDWFLDATVGVPWFQLILGSKLPLSVIIQELQYVVTSCPGVASVEVFTLTQVSGRTYQCEFSCTLTDGTTLTAADLATPFVVPNFTGGS